ncbi:MAG: histidine phosphatase family protein [Ilumatobacteraceae bacterium]
MVLSIVRHARTEANAGGRLQGTLDLPLDEVGLQQAAKLPVIVRDIDRVVCSPLARARQTASVFGLEPTVDERLREVDYGPFEGHRIADLPQEMWRRWVTELDYAPEGGESLQAMSARVIAALEDLAAEAEERHIVVVTHATPVKAAMAWALGVDVGIASRSWVDQASVTRILVRSGRPVLSSFNIVP